MTGDEYQQLAGRTASKDSMYESLINYSMGLFGEAGELVDHLKKVLFHGHPANKPLIREEAGDVLWYLANILAEFGITLDEVMEQNIEKLRRRYPNGFELERSRNRATFTDDGY